MKPDSWLSSTVGESCTIANWARLPLSSEQRQQMQGRYPYFGPTGIIDWLNEYRVDGEFALIGEDGDHFLKFKSQDMTVRYSGKANVNNHAHIIKRSTSCTPGWFYYYFLHRDITAWLSRQGAKRYKLKKADLEKLPLVLPPLPEQDAIVAALDKWTNAIEVCSQLIESSIQQKKALGQQLLTGKRRLPGFTDEWRHVHLSDVCERVTRKNDAGIGNVLTISAQHGLVSQQDYFNKPVASSDLSKYTHLKRGDFAYNKSYSAGFPMGAIKELSLYAEGVVSSLYICFRRKRDGLGEQAFLRHFFESGMLNREIYAFAQEGARNHGLLNIAVGDFFNCRLKVPNRDEQLAIATALDLADQCVVGQKKQLELLEKEKRALMQQLLTGKRRVKLIPEHATPAKEIAS